MRQQTNNEVREFIVLTPYPVEPDHELLSIVRVAATEDEVKPNAVHIAKGDNAGIVINKKANILDYNRTQAGQKERQQPPSAKMSFKVFLINSATGKMALEHRTLRFWLDQSAINDSLNCSDEGYRSTRTFANVRQESSQLAQDYFRQLIGTKPDDDFPKNYAAFIMKVMRLLKTDQFTRIIKMEIEMRQSSYEGTNKPPSRACKCTHDSNFNCNRLTNGSFVSLGTPHEETDWWASGGGGIIELTFVCVFGCWSLPCALSNFGDPLIHLSNPLFLCPLSSLAKVGTGRRAG